MKMKSDALEKRSQVFKVREASKLGIRKMLLFSEARESSRLNQIHKKPREFDRRDNSVMEIAKLGLKILRVFST